MKKIKHYYYLLLVSVFFAIISFGTNSKSTIDINIHDTYFVIEHTHLYRLFAFILFLFFTIYFSFEKGKIKLISILSKLHIYGNFVSITGIFFPYSLIYKPSNFQLFDDLQYSNLCMSISGLLFLFLQFFFIINIFVSLIKKMRLLHASQ
jgi:heme/copper-type cytochrome/quinol oxidase subunit 1